ncbi:hypothetical protein B0H66DRAFT_626611, partial [Apodospora peruviana]
VTCANQKQSHQTSSVYVTNTPHNSRLALLLRLISPLLLDLPGNSAIQLLGILKMLIVLHPEQPTLPLVPDLGLGQQPGDVNPVSLGLDLIEPEDQARVHVRPRLGGLVRDLLRLRDPVSTIQPIAHDDVQLRERVEQDEGHLVRRAPVRNAAEDEDQLRETPQAGEASPDPGRDAEKAAARAAVDQTGRRPLLDVLVGALEDEGRAAPAHDEDGVSPVRVVHAVRFDGCGANVEELDHSEEDGPPRQRDHVGQPDPRHLGRHDGEGQDAYQREPGGRHPGQKNGVVPGYVAVGFIVVAAARDAEDGEPAVLEELAVADGVCGLDVAQGRGLAAIGGEVAERRRVVQH